MMSWLDAFLLLFKTTYLLKLFPSDCITLQLPHTVGFTLRYPKPNVWLILATVFELTVLQLVEAADQINNIVNVFK